MKDILFEARFELNQHIVKKNSRPIWNNRLGKSQRLVTGEKELLLKLLPYKKGTITDFVNVEMIFYFHHKYFYTVKKNVNKKLPDLSNLYQIVEDQLEKAGVLKNDHLIQGHDGSRRLPGPKTELSIKITSIDYNMLSGVQLGVIDEQEAEKA